METDTYNRTIPSLRPGETGVNLPKSPSGQRGANIGMVIGMLIEMETEMGLEIRRFWSHAE
jgi:hypothetical protein